MSDRSDGGASAPRDDPTPRDDDVARRAARRAAARRHHPDVGGDPSAFIEAMAESDAREVEVPPLYDVRPSSRLKIAGRRVRRTVRTVRGRLPRRIPGSARYHQI